MMVEPNSVKVNTRSKGTIRSLKLAENYDVLALLLGAALLPWLMLLDFPLIRVPLGLGLVLFAPGYALTQAVFTRQDKLDKIAVVSISFGLSLASLPLLVLIINMLPWGIRPWPMALSLSVWLMVLSGIAALRRWWDSSLETVPVITAPGWWQSQSIKARLGYVVGGFLIVAFLTAGAIVVLSPAPGEKLTEFYAVGAQNLAEGYPREVAIGQPMQVQFGLVNQEGKATNYRIEIRSGGKLLTQTDPIRLESGAKWEQPLRYQLDKAGDNQLVEVMLFSEQKSEPYRRLRLWVNVRG